MPASPVVLRQEIAAPVTEVWEVISKAGHLEECHPFCAANPVDAWPGLGSRDHLHYYSGRTISRRFVGWHDGVGYDIEITDPRGVVAEAEWRLSGHRAASELTIAITPHLLGGLPRVLRWVPDRILMRPRLARYLRAVLSGIEWRVTTGRPVRRNQFGPHPWFSPAVTEPGAPAGD